MFVAQSGQSQFSGLATRGMSRHNIPNFFKHDLHSITVVVCSSQTFQSIFPLLISPILKASLQLQHSQESNEFVEVALRVLIGKKLVRKMLQKWSCMIPPSTRTQNSEIFS